MSNTSSRMILGALGASVCIGLLFLGAPPRGAEGAPTPGGAPAWLHMDWAYRIQVTAEPDSVEPGDHLDFPAVIRLGAANTDVFLNARSDGGDLLVTKADGTTSLGMELVVYDSNAPYAELWFEADTLSKTKNVFYLYYGNANASPPVNDGSAWNPDYVAVYHFQDDPASGTLTDATVRHSDGSSAFPGAAWTSGDVESGLLGQAWTFNGTTHWVDGDQIATTDSSYVISAWLKCPTNTTDFTFQANPGYWHVSAQINETHRRPHFGAANPWRDLRWDPNPLPNDDLFHYYTWVFDGEADTILFYFDGIQQPATPWSIDPGARFYTGSPINPTKESPSGAGIVGPMSWNSMDLMDGPADEFRVSEKIHSGAWIRTEYRNQRDPAGFFTLDSPEIGGGVPVDLLYFTATREPAGAVLRWEAGVTGDHAGYEVHRESAGEPRTRLTESLITGDGALTFTDRSAPAGPVEYWLAEISRTGGLSWYGPAVLDAGTGGPGIALLAQNRPNPFRADTRIAFSVPSAGPVRLRIFDVAGRTVATLVDGVLTPGTHEEAWDGQSEDGGIAGPGIYFYRLETAEGTLTRRLVRIP